MRANEKKDIKYLNVCIERSLHEEFEAFCQQMGMSKTGACEKALRMYMDKMKPVQEAMDAVK